MIRILLTFPLLLSLLACETIAPKQSIQFSTEPTLTPIDANQINEVSGMVDSRSVPGTLWTAQDGGNPAELVLLGYDGKIRAKLPVPGAANRDWEDLTSGPGPQAGINYLYLADIGDNTAQHATGTVYRMPEPASPTSAITGVERITFSYPDGPRDAETLLLDPQTKDLYVVSKQDSKARLYRLAYPQRTQEPMVAEALGELPHTLVTGGAFSPDGSEIILRTYTNVYYWPRKSNQTVADAMQRTPAVDLPYRIEQQGEAICFDRDSKGYFTLSEKRSGANMGEPTLNYYGRK